MRTLLQAKNRAGIEVICAAVRVAMTLLPEESDQKQTITRRIAMQLSGVGPNPKPMLILTTFQTGAAYFL